MKPTDAQIFASANFADRHSANIARLLEQGNKRDEVRMALNDFGLDEFLSPAQEAAVIAVHAGENVVVVLPTGGGKSLIYQLPARMAQKASDTPGVTLVLAPTVALVRDASCAPSVRCNLPGVVHIDESTLYTERNEIFRRLSEKDPLLLELHITPAMLVTSRQILLGGSRYS